MTNLNMSKETIGSTKDAYLGEGKTSQHGGE